LNDLLKKLTKLAQLTSLQLVVVFALLGYRKSLRSLRNLSSTDRKRKLKCLPTTEGAYNVRQDILDLVLRRGSVLSLNAYKYSE